MKNTIRFMVTDDKYVWPYTQEYDELVEIDVLRG